MNWPSNRRKSTLLVIPSWLISVGQGASPPVVASSVPYDHPDNHDGAPAANAPSTASKILDWTQTAFRVAGLAPVPVLGDIFNVANVGIDLLRGNTADLAMDTIVAAAGVLPGGADVARGFEAAEETVAIARGGEDALTLFHGTDIASATDIVNNGFDLGKAAEVGGGDALWTTTAQSDAELFAQVNPVAGEPAVVGIKAPRSLINELSNKGLVNIDGPVHTFEPGAIDFLNSRTQRWIVK